MSGTAKRIAIAVVRRGEQYLVGQRPEGVPLAGFWEFPGGKIRSGESAEEAAARECLEETGLRVKVGRRLIEHTEQYDFGRVHLEFFDCRPVDAEHPVHAPFRWVPAERLSALEFPSGNQHLLRLLGRA